MIRHRTKWCSRPLRKHTRTWLSRRASKYTFHLPLAKCCTTYLSLIDTFLLFCARLLYNILWALFCRTPSLGNLLLEEINSHIPLYFETCDLWEASGAGFCYPVFFVTFPGANMCKVIIIFFSMTYLVIKVNCLVLLKQYICH